MIIKGIQYYMLLTGTWNMSWTENSTLRKIQFWYSRCVNVILNVTILLMVVRLMELIKIKADAGSYYKCLSVLLPIMQLSITLFLYKKNNVTSLFNEISIEEKDIMKSDGEIINCYKREVNKSLWLKNVLVGVSAPAPLVIFIVNFIVYVLRGNDIALKGERELILHDFFLPIWIPNKKSGNITLEAFINLILLSACCHMFLSVFITIFSLMMFVAIELKMLQVLIRSLDSSSNKSITNYYNTLRRIVEKHLFVIGFVKKLNDSTRYIMLAYFLLNSINLALVTIGLMWICLMKWFKASCMLQKMQRNYYILETVEVRYKAPTVTETFHFGLHFWNIIIYIIVLGWFANEIKIQSLIVGDVLYETKWYNHEIPAQKAILTIIHRTQQPLMLSIALVGPMTIGTSIAELRTLECRHCNLQRINTQIYHLLPYLTHLDLGYNQMQFLDHDEFQDLHKLHSLKLDGNMFPVILENTFVKQQQLKYLTLAKNRIAKIPDTALKNLTSLAELDIGYNKLPRVDAVAFSHVAKSLQKLVISGNNLNTDTIKSIVATLYNLWDLSVAHTKIKDISNDFFPDRIKSLNLSGNNISDITPEMFPKEIIALDISNNQIKGLNKSTLLFLETVKKINISQNPWTCNLCHITEIYFRVNKTNLLKNATCAFPSVLKGKQLVKLSLEEIPACDSLENNEGDSPESNKKGLLIGFICIVTFAVSSIIFVVGSCVRRHHQNRTRREKRTSEGQENNIEHATAIFSKNQISFQFPLDLTARKLSVSTIDEIKKDERQGMSNGTITTGL